MEKQRRDLFDKITGYVWGDRNSDIFDTLCLDVFEYQYTANEPYRRYCQGKGINLKDVSCWLDIPAYPSEAFKKDTIVSFPMEKMVMENITGGTTCPELRGSVFRDEYGKKLALECNRRVMGDYLFPEGERMPILVLAR